MLQQILTRMKSILMYSLLRDPDEGRLEERRIITLYSYRWGHIICAGDRVVQLHSGVDDDLIRQYGQYCASR